MEAEQRPDYIAARFRDNAGLAPRSAVGETSVPASDAWQEVGAYTPDPATSDVFQVSVPATNGATSAWRIEAK